MAESGTARKILQSFWNSAALKEAQARHKVDVSATTVVTVPSVTDPVVVYYTGTRMETAIIRRPRKRRKKHKKRHLILFCIDNGP